LAAEPKQVDGQDNDWADGSFLNFKSADVDYAVANDGDHLYLIFIFKDKKDKQGMSTIEVTGVKIYLSEAGKKNKDVAFHFQKKLVKAEETIARLES